MIIELTDTNGQEINSTLLKLRRNLGVASGLVFTLIIVCGDKDREKAVQATMVAAREHPSRIIMIVPGGDGEPKLDATLHTGEEAPGDVITLTVFGELLDHIDSVVTSLLLPDLPVVVWWPFESPDHPSQDPLGKLGTRRITDAAGHRDPIVALKVQAGNHAAGDTDLCWTRLTPWRALLAASLDQFPRPVLAAVVEADPANAPAMLLASWLQARLQVDCQIVATEGPGITAVRLRTDQGDMALERVDGRLATYVVPGQPKRTVALRRRELSELVTEELRRMDADDIFEQTLQTLLNRNSHQ